MLLHCFLAFVTTCYATSSQQRQLGPPTVKIQNGTVVGQSDGTVESFKGIPYAQPPVGNLRLRPPQTITKTFGTLTLGPEPTACPQQVGVVNTAGLPPEVAQFVNNITSGVSGPSGEDCLTVNVQRPAGTTASSNLPVLFWIYGGGFELGATQTFDATAIIQKSILLQKPIIYVSVNYRVNGFGFLAGSELQKEGCTNLGLRDQRLGLEWAAENIKAFGGDPSKVTIWGESAGSISVFDQLIINGGNIKYRGKPLFRGAIMDSGSVLPAQDVASPKAQSVYDEVVSAANCSSAADTVACLRSLSYPDFLAAVLAQPSFISYTSVNVSYLPRPDPSNSFFSASPDTISKSKAYARVPIIIGDQEDEGTLFSLFQRNISTTAQLTNYLASFFTETPKQITAGLVAVYPDSPAAGSPFGTGNQNQLYPQFKRLAALFGDLFFTLARRVYLTYAAAEVPAWSYLATYLHGTPILGTPHASDILVDYYDSPDAVIASAVQQYYISFVYYLDPNRIPLTPPMIEWPRWTAKTKQLINLKAGGIGKLTDTFRKTQFAYISKHQHDIKL